MLSRAYLTSGFSGVHLFLYSIWYFFSKLNIDSLVGAVLYFAYMGMVRLYLTCFRKL